MERRKRRKSKDERELESFFEGLNSDAARPAEKGQHEFGQVKARRRIEYAEKADLWEEKRTERGGNTQRGRARPANGGEDDKRRERPGTKSEGAARERGKEHFKVLGPDDKETKNSGPKLSAAAKGVIILAALVAVVICFALIKLRVEAIQIIGLETRSEESVLSLIDISVGDQMLLVSTRKAARAIDEDPYFAVLSVDKLYPVTIRINLRERIEKAAIMGINEAVVIDDEGYVLAIKDKPYAQGLLKVYGVMSIGFHVNQLLSEESDFHASTLIAILQKLCEYEIIDHIDSLDVSNPLSVYMISKSGVKIQIGQPEKLDEKLSKLKLVMPKLEEMKLTDGTLMLIGDGRAVYSPESTTGLTFEPDLTPDPNATISPDMTPDPEQSIEPSATNTP